MGDGEVEGKGFILGEDSSDLQGEAGFIVVFVVDSSGQSAEILVIEGGGFFIIVSRGFMLDAQFDLVVGIGEDSVVSSEF